jgi:hypothetical protein
MDSCRRLAFGGVQKWRLTSEDAVTNQPASLFSSQQQDIMSNRGFAYTTSGRLSGTLEPVSNAIPTPGDDEVVIKIKAMALNPVDEQL